MNFESISSIFRILAFLTMWVKPMMSATLFYPLAFMIDLVNVSDIIGAHSTLAVAQLKILSFETVQLPLKLLPAGLCSTAVERHRVLVAHCYDQFYAISINENQRKTKIDINII